eukprot:Nitzschia sp. Nitz4//scaffold45_size130396//16298//19740//NITZ4_003431-RA/size130396-augustus-gene-0.252-mRNA-1//-1//CDS//3329552344//7581//frame0
MATQDEAKTPSKANGGTPVSSVRKSPSSPKISYIQLVIDAIIAMKGRNGSSQIAIQKYILSNHPEVPPDKLKQRLLHTLRSGVANKRLVKIKASYKVVPPKVKKKKKEPSSAAKKEKDKQQAKEKERLEKIRKRRFPMDDLDLIAQDKELKVTVSLPPRPTLPFCLPGHLAACKSLPNTGFIEDALQIYHFFRGDVSWGRMNKQEVAPFTLQQWLGALQYVLEGSARKARLLPPLITHLFVVTLQHLIPPELALALTPATWSEILLLYADAMERYYTSDVSLESTAMPSSGIDTKYLFGATDSPDDPVPPMSRDSYFYLQQPLEKLQKKLLTCDPWMLTAEELLSLLKILTDDLLANQPDLSLVMDDRLQETYELLKRKKEADAHFRKLQALGKKEQNEDKEIRPDTKATRSNTKLPTVSESQLESAKRAQMRATDAYEKACRSHRVRTEPIGVDRHFNSFFHFGHDPEQVYVQIRGKAQPAPIKVPGAPEAYRSTWHTIDKRSLLEKLIESLDVRGKRECALAASLNSIVKLVNDDIKQDKGKKALLKDKREMERRLENVKLKMEVGRKSDRLVSQSEQEVAVLQSEIEGLEQSLQGSSTSDMQEDTGLVMLRKFDGKDDNNRRRPSRRDTKASDQEEPENMPSLPCSKLWATGNIDGTGVVGSIVWELLELEERIEKLAPTEGDRASWISTLENAAHAWHLAAPPAGSETQENGVSVSQTVMALKHPILMLEQRLFETTGLAMAARDADLADDNMSASPEDSEEEQLQLAWKKLVARLYQLPAKAYIKIRQVVVEAIAAARKAQQPEVVAHLRAALLQFHPEAAGSCKAEALKILEQHGGYAEDEDDEELQDMDEDEEETPEPVPHQQVGLSKVLSFEAVVLNSSLDGFEDSSRNDWITAVKKAKTISKIGALVAGFCSKASKKLAKMESEQDVLREAIAGWEKASTQRKKTKPVEPSEVWAYVTFTDDFVLVKVEEYPWWPAKRCVVKDPALAASLETLDRSVVALVGESGALRVVAKDRVLPFSETPPEDEAGNHSKEIRTQLDECMAMTRRIIRGKSKSSRKRKSEEFKEEKKLST